MKLNIAKIQQIDVFQSKKVRREELFETSTYIHTYIVVLF